MYTFLKLAEDTLKKAGRPLTAEEIWESSLEFGFREKIETVGLTPWRSIGAQIYVDMKNNENSIFYKIGKNPVRFALSTVKMSEVKEVIPKTEKTAFHERDLHPLLSSYVFGEQHFRCYTKTIFHEKSNKRKSGENHWLHPDIVGVYFPFDDFHSSTVTIIDSLKENTIKLFSFEMKIKIAISNLREYYFQAVSNSSWAHEGYLVALEYDEGEDLLSEMRRLSASFGIGFIKLNPENIEQSEIIISAKPKETIDWETVNRLVEDNCDFKDFVDSINDAIKLGKVTVGFDKVLLSDDLINYIKDKKIRSV